MALGFVRSPHGSGMDVFFSSAFSTLVVRTGTSDVAAAASSDCLIWLWLQKPVPKWNPGKWKHGPKPA